MFSGVCLFHFFLRNIEERLVLQQFLYVSNSNPHLPSTSPWSRYSWLIRQLWLIACFMTFSVAYGMADYLQIYKLLRSTMWSHNSPLNYSVLMDVIIFKEIQSIQCNSPDKWIIIYFSRDLGWKNIQTCGVGLDLKYCMYWYFNWNLRQHGGLVVSTIATLRRSWAWILGAFLCQTCMFPCVCMGFLSLLRFSPTVSTHFLCVLLKTKNY